MFNSSKCTAYYVLSYLILLDFVSLIIVNKRVGLLKSYVPCKENGG